MTAISLAPIAWGGVVLAWGFMGLAFWILLVALIVLLVRGTRTPARDSAGGAVRLLESATRAARSRARTSWNAAPCSVAATSALPPTTRSSAVAQLSMNW